MSTTSFVTTMAVNVLVTGLIVFKILKVFLEVKANSTSVEQSLRSTGGTEFRHIIFVIIESGTTLLVIQVVRLAFFVVEQSQLIQGPVYFGEQYGDVIGQMFNVIIKSVHLYFFCSIEIFYLARASHQQ